MSIIRSYFSKQSTLIKDNYTNNSQNPVFELTRSKNLYSRYIFEVDITKLREDYIINNYSIDKLLSHTINFTSSIRLREDLIGKEYVGASTRDTNFELQLTPVTESFGEGQGFDYIYSTGLTNNLTPTTQIPNWYYRDQQNQWDISGVYSSSTPLATTKVLKGSESISFNVTNYINEQITASTSNTLSFALAYTPEYETGVTSDIRYVTSFFSRATQSYFEPYLQSTINDVILDTRNKFKMGVDNKLYLKSSSDISVFKVEILDDTNTVISAITGPSIKKVQKGVYEIDVNISPIDYCDYVNFTDKWYYTLNGNIYNHSQYFTLYENNIFEDEYEGFENSDFSFSLTGIKDSENINQESFKRKIELDIKRLYQNKIENIYDYNNVEYRVYMKQGNVEFEVIPYQKVSNLNDRYYFYLDTSWMIPQTYFLEVRILKDNIVHKNDTTKFQVASIRF